jgi:ATP-dependent Clp protease, protease subunit
MYNRDFKLFANSKGIATTTLEHYIKHTNAKHLPAALTPSIVEERSHNVAVMDVFSRMMMEGVIFLGEVIDDYVANIVVAQLLFLNSMQDTDIKMYINTPGGSVYDGNSILDVMDFVKLDVSTLCTGMAASMGAVILSNGAKGKRSALRRSRIMIHQPMGGSGYGLQASDVEINAKELNKVKRELSLTLAENTGQKVSRITKDSDRDKWFTADEALAYGFIDKVVKKQ